MDKKDVKEFIDLLQSSSLCSLKIKTECGELHLQKETVATAIALAPKESSVEDRPASLAVTPNHHEKNIVKAPLVATCYLAPSPNAETFVSAGKKVNVGDVLCILEAMKTMHEIKCEKPGLIKEVLVEDAMSVEFGQPLFVVE